MLHQSLKFCYRSTDDKAHAIPGTKSVEIRNDAERLISHKHPDLCPVLPRPSRHAEMLHLLFLTSEEVKGYGAGYDVLHFLVLLGILSQGKAIL